MGPLLCSDVAVLAAQVTDLAGFGLAGVAGRGFTALVRVKMSTSTSAVAVGRHRLLVNVVDERTALGWETRERDGELDAVAIIGRDSSNRATNSVLLLIRQGSNVRGALGVAGNYGSRDNGRGLSSDSRSCSDERKDLDTHVESECEVIWKELGSEGAFSNCTVLRLSEC